jgi:NAD(P)-dependent dehydrogenase (short-subunit alcohol dehydrogenase family)
MAGTIAAASGSSRPDDSVEAGISQRLDNKVTLITGGSSGIGQAAAKLFAREGAKVVVADLDAERGEETIEAIRSSGGISHFIKTDVAVPLEVEALVRRVVELHGRLDCAYNNAGILGDIVPLVEHTEESWDHTLDTNLKGTWLCMKYEIPQMLKQGAGAIVNTTATAALKGSPNRSAYAASKAGIIAVSKSAAMEYAEHGLRINVICPSHTRSNMLKQFFELRPELEASFIASAPMARIAAPEEVAEGALWLCSEASSFVTGHVLAVEGGYLAR